MITSSDRHCGLTDKEIIQKRLYRQSNAQYASNELLAGGLVASETLKLLNNQIRRDCIHYLFELATL